MNRRCRRWPAAGALALLLLAAPLARTATAQPSDQPPPSSAPAAPPPASDSRPTATPAPTVAPTPSAAAADALARFRRGMLEMQFSFFTGVRLYRAGRALDIGLFGDDAERAFAGSSAALDAYGTYRVLRITGFVLWTVGLAALLAEIVMLAADRDLLIDRSGIQNEIRPAFWGILIPSATVGLVGGVMFQQAAVYLSDAARLYNAHLYEQLSGQRGASAPLPRAAWLRFARRF